MDAAGVCVAAAGECADLLASAARAALARRQCRPALLQIVRYAASNYVGTPLYLAYTNRLPLMVANRLCQA